MTPLGSLRSVKAWLSLLRTGRNAIVAYRLDPDVSGAYQRAWRTLVEPGSSILQVSITSGSFDVFGQLQNHLRIFVDVDAAHPPRSRSCRQYPICQLHVSCTLRVFRRTHCSVDRCLLTRVASSDGPPRGKHGNRHSQLAELHGRARYTWRLRLVGRVLSEVRSDGSGWDAFLALSPRWRSPSVQCGRCRSRRRVVSMSQCCLAGDISRWAPPAICRTHLARVYPEAAQPLLAMLNSDGSLAQNLGYTGGARHNQLTTITSRMAAGCLAE